jgi:prophage maintenance system killer protein
MQKCAINRVFLGANNNKRTAIHSIKQFMLYNTLKMSNLNLF